MRLLDRLFIFPNTKENKYFIFLRIFQHVRISYNCYKYVNNIRLFL